MYFVYKNNKQRCPNYLIKQIRDSLQKNWPRTLNSQLFHATSDKNHDLWVAKILALLSTTTLPIQTTRSTKPFIVLCFAHLYANTKDFKYNNIVLYDFGWIFNDRESVMRSKGSTTDFCSIIFRVITRSLAISPFFFFFNLTHFVKRTNSWEV